MQKKTFSHCDAKKKAEVTFVGVTVWMHSLTARRIDSTMNKIKFWRRKTKFVAKGKKKTF